MKGIAFALIAAAALCGCDRGSKAPAANAGNDLVTTATAPTPPDPSLDTAERLIGRYRLAGDDGPDKGVVTIAKGEGQTYLVMVDVGTQGCAGQAKGSAIRQGEGLRLTARIPDTALKCELDLRPQPEGTLLVEDAGGCRDFHGAACDLNGTATRTAVH
jgi:hypothetical protein